MKISRSISRFKNFPALLITATVEIARTEATSEYPDTKRVDVSSAILDTFHDFPTVGLLSLPRTPLYSPPPPPFLLVSPF